MIEATTSGSGDEGPNFETSTPHRRARNIHPRSASREIFNVTKAEREANIEPHACRMIAGRNWWRSRCLSFAILSAKSSRANVHVTLPLGRHQLVKPGATVGKLLGLTE